MKTFFTIFCLVVSFTAFSQTIRYVNSKATGANDGTSWANAFTKLQNALAAATSGDQLWVAGGRYYPDEGAAQTNDDRHASFTLKNKVAIYGGFAGTETELSQRNWQTNATILSGDLQQNDGENAANNGDNSFHVITGEGTDNTTLLDGLTITAGNANTGKYYDDGGGGGLQLNIVNPGSVTIVNCSFVKNKAVYGGGICNNTGVLKVAHCSFSGNRADEGGAMWIFGNLSTFTDCSFTKDTATYGAAINFQSGAPELINCNFSENWGYFGGAIFIDESDVNVINCTFSKNSALAGDGGGAIWSQGVCSPILTNCTFSENTAQDGGAIFNYNAHITANGCSFQSNIAGTKGGVIHGDAGSESWFTNCLFFKNSAPIGGVVSCWSGDNTLTNCSVWGNSGSFSGVFYGEHYARLFVNNSSISGNNAGAAKVIMNLDLSSTTFTNSILWGNTSSGAILFDAGSSASVSYSIVEGGFSGTNVLNQDPLFADVANGDLHLLPCSPAIDAGEDASNNTETDLDSNARKIDAVNLGNVIDMGAYEFQSPLDADNDGHTICKNDDCDDNNANVWRTGTFYKDADDDGYTTGDGESVCYGNGTPAGYSVTKSDTDDCNDDDANVHAPQQYYVDADQDGYGSSTTAMLCASTPPDGYSTNNTDCDDNNASVWHPGTFYKDADGDGYTTGDAVAICYGDDSPVGYSVTKSASDDCDDNNASVWRTGTFYKDADGDGYTTGDGELVFYGNNAPAGYAVKSDFDDCNDNDANVYAPHQYYVDADHDGYGSATTAMLCSSTVPDGYSTSNTDCDDNNANVHPLAKEICGNGIDDNCNGEIDEGYFVCTNATGLKATDIAFHKATLSWKSRINPEKWRIEYKKAKPGAKWKRITLPGSARSVGVSALAGGQTYKWHVRVKCGKTWGSYSNTAKFSTRSWKSVRYINTKALSVKNDSIKLAEAIKLYPNPTNGPVTIELHLSDDITASAKIELMNIAGQKVLRENANISHGTLYKTISISSSLPSGTYLINILVNNKAYHAKLVYQK